MFRGIIVHSPFTFLIQVSLLKESQFCDMIKTIVVRRDTTKSYQTMIESLPFSEREFLESIESLL